MNTLHRIAGHAEVASLTYRQGNVDWFDGRLSRSRTEAQGLSSQPTARKGLLQGPLRSFPNTYGRTSQTTE